MAASDQALLMATKVAKNINVLPKGSSNKVDLENCVTNYFKVTLSGPTNVYMYPISSPNWALLPRRLRNKLINNYLRSVAFPGDEITANNDKVISDLVHVFSTVEIPKERLVESIVNVSGDSFKIALLEPRILQLKSEQDLAQVDMLLSQVYNLILSKAMRKFLDRSPRGYFERTPAEVRTRNRNMDDQVRLFRGYTAAISLKHFAVGRFLTLNIDPISRVIGMDNVLDAMRKRVGQQSFSNLTSTQKVSLRKFLIGKAVHTVYNSKPYIIEDVDFNKNPDFEFEMGASTGEARKISIKEYLQKYQSETYVTQDGTNRQRPIELMIRDQPLIRTTGRGRRRIYLVPEKLAFIETSKAVKEELPAMCSISPNNRFNLMRRLSELLESEGGAKRVLSAFNLKIEPRPLQIRARQLTGMPDFDMWGTKLNPQQAWGPATRNLFFKDISQEAYVNFDSVFLITERHSRSDVERLLGDISAFFRAWNAPAKLPARQRVFTIEMSSTSDPYNELKANQAFLEFNARRQSLPAGQKAPHALVLGLLCDNEHEAKYQRIREFCAEFGVIEQVVNGGKFLKAKAQAVIKANVGKQILNKLGFFTWQIDFHSLLPPRVRAFNQSNVLNMMFVGIDVHHARKVWDDSSRRYRQRRSLGAFVSIMYEIHAGKRAKTYVYSDIVAKAGREEIIANNIEASDCSSTGSGSESETEGSREEVETPTITSERALEEFLYRAMVHHRFYPHVIVVYRDGVADSQMEKAKAEELAQVATAIERARQAAGKNWSTKIVFNVIQKNISTKFGAIQGGNLQNVANLPSGTVVDADIRSPEYDDWFLVASRERSERGQAAITVKPVRYVVLRNDLAETSPIQMSSEDLQKLTYALHGVYPNWTDFVKLPVVTQCAHKFAKTFGDINLLEPKIHDALKSTLFFL